MNRVLLKLLAIKNPSFLPLYRKQEEAIRNQTRLKNGMQIGNGHVSWYKDGKLHRDNDLPAIVYDNGDKAWWSNGVLVKVYNAHLAVTRYYAKTPPHKDNDFPIVKALLHRDDDLPAEEYNDGSKRWVRNGQLHRDGGKPAIEHASGCKEWWVYGSPHREDGPAIEWKDQKQWWYKGLIHREDGPALEKSDGTKEWYIKGLLHRECNPARELHDGNVEWWENGVCKSGRLADGTWMIYQDDKFVESTQAPSTELKLNDKRLIWKDGKLFPEETPVEKPKEEFQV